MGRASGDARYREVDVQVRCSTSRLLTQLLLTVALSGGIALAQVPGDRAATGIHVNGVELSVDTVRALQQIYPVAIAPGRYWYDRISGAYGREGNPVAGQMMAGLDLGGPLRSDASLGNSGIYINGRQVTAGEKAYLEQLCQVPIAPARYWVLFNGLGGFEGGPPNFNLGQCPGIAQQSNVPRSQSRTYCDGNGNCTSTGVLGYISTTPR
jgi:hypothetical protein